MDVVSLVSIRRIGLIGAECTGKSTIASALAVALNGLIAREVLREFVAEHGRVPEAGEQRQVMLEQIAREDSLIGSAGSQAVIGDPAPVMTAVYSDVYYADRALLPAAVEHACAYDLVLWCRPDLPWIPDPGQRDGPEYRALIDERIDRLVGDWLLPAGIHVVELSGSHESRLAVAIGAACSIGASQQQGMRSRAWQPSESDPAN